jgi:hypothetical protein
MHNGVYLFAFYHMAVIRDTSSYCREKMRYLLNRYYIIIALERRGGIERTGIVPSFIMSVLFIS